MTTCLSAKVPDERGWFNPEEITKLENGEVVVSRSIIKVEDGNTVHSYVGSVLVHLPEEVLWEILNYPERQAEWLSWIQKSELLSERCVSENKKIKVVEYEASILFINAQYTLIYEFDYTKRSITGVMDMTKPKEFFEYIKNGYEFFPYEDGYIFQYWSYSKQDLYLPEFLLNYLARRTVTSGVGKVVEECERVAKERKEKIVINTCQKDVKSGDIKSGDTIPNYDVTY